MNERIQRLVHQVLTSDINPPTHEIECDPFDEKLSEPMFVAKRFCEFYNAQPIVIGDDNELVGHIRFDKTPVPADIFHRSGHAKFREVSAKYYGKPQENLCTFEWQHSNADFGKLIRLGLNGYVKEINASRKKFLGERGHLQFLAALERVIHGIGQRADAYRQRCVDLAEACEDPARKATLLRMAANCANVPMNPARSFEEAVQCVYFCFAFLPDSIGRPDQYLYPLYKQGIADGTLTSEHATELIQELFIMIHGHTPFNSGWAGDKGAESHFAIGGYTIDHEDGFNELSKLIIEAMMDMPLIRPQVSLRWNKKTPHDVLRYMMDWERKDKNKRIAFVNDEPRIAGLMKLFSTFIRMKGRKLVRDRVRFRVIGRREDLSPALVAAITRLEEQTASFEQQLVLAVSYGGRAEIADAARRLVADAAAGRLRPEDVDEARVAGCLYAPDLPDPDLIIRTSGEQRISNFLLWECAYSEFYFTDRLWPDFSRAAFDAALAAYAARDRRKGGHA